MLDISTQLRSRRLDEDVEAAAYYVVAESLTNVVRHSGAPSACVSLKVDSTRLSIVVADNGIGFEPDGARLGSGIQGLADRLQVIGGSLSVSSTPGKGTEIRATLPVRSAAPV